MVSMGNGSTLSGFDLRTTADDNNGVIATNTSGFTIDRNQIDTEGDTAKGVYVRGNNNAALGMVTISGNTISTSGNVEAFGIHVDASTASIATATISGNTVVTTGNPASGIYVRAQNAGGVIDSATIANNIVTTTGNYGDGVVIAASGPNATIRNATITGNTVSTAGNYADGIFIQTLGLTSTIASTTVTDNLILQAGTHSVVIQARNGTETICIAQFSGNTSSMPDVFGTIGGGNDLNFNPSAGTPGTINFVDFANVAANNFGFDDIVIDNGTVTSIGTCL